MSTRAATYPDPIIKGDWCQPSLYGDAQKSLIPRNEACLFHDIGYRVTQSVNGIPVAEYNATLDFHFQVTTDPHTGDIKTWIQIYRLYNGLPADERADGWMPKKLFLNHPKPRPTTAASTCWTTPATTRRPGTRLAAGHRCRRT
ncbi:hypothetical protein [Streptomyces sp. NPDC057496]|uniref:hypothetical protein n=1 Tax=Streptomyces sp. NPDC057496 TaxID=3346149 RepID=UPI0036A76E3C